MTSRTIETEISETLLADQLDSLLRATGYVNAGDRVLKVSIGDLEKPRHKGTIPLKVTIQKEEMVDTIII